MFMMKEFREFAARGNVMDLAINGTGFIELMGPGGETLLWRGGPLKAGDDGRLMTASGLELKANIALPADTTNLEIGSDGVVRAKTGGAGELVEIGQIMLVKVEDPGSVEAVDGGFFKVRDGAQLADAKPGEDWAGVLVQGSLERSTVDLNAEMVAMLMVQRAYAANAQVVQAADQLLNLANQLRR